MRLHAKLLQISSGWWHPRRSADEEMQLCMYTRYLCMCTYARGQETTRMRNASAGISETSVMDGALLPIQQSASLLIRVTWARVIMMVMVSMRLRVRVIMMVSMRVPVRVRVRVRVR